MASIDGCIVIDAWPLSEDGRRQYELLHESYDAQGWLCGRMTMEQHFAQRVRSNAEIDSEGDKVCVRYHFEGTHAGIFRRMAPRPGRFRLNWHTELAHNE